jgi:phosphomannomutase
VAMAAVISGGDWPQFEKQLVSRLRPGTRLDRLFIMPTTGAKLFRFSNEVWHQVYAETFSPEERDRTLTALDRAAAEAGSPDKTWGPQIEDRGSQITFSALGQEAPIDAKKAWDPSMSKRQTMQRQLSAALPDLSVKMGGSTSIDITRAGVDKAFAIARLVEHAKVAPDAILFLGDAIYPGGNDEPVRSAGIDSIRVRDPAETAAIIDALVAWMR